MKIDASEKKTRLKALIGVSIMIFSLLSPIILTIVKDKHQAYADGFSPADTLLLEVIKDNFKKCISNGVLKRSDITRTDKISEDDIFDRSNSYFANDQKVFLPYKYGTGNTLKDAGLSCQQLFKGFNDTDNNKFTTYMELGGRDPADIYRDYYTGNDKTERINEFLEALGYYSTSNTKTQMTCASLAYVSTKAGVNSGIERTNEICVRTVGDDEIITSSSCLDQEQSSSTNCKKRLTNNDVVVRNKSDTQPLSLKYENEEIQINVKPQSAIPTNGCTVRTDIYKSKKKINDYKGKSAREFFENFFDEMSSSLFRDTKVKSTKLSAKGDVVECKEKTLAEVMGVTTVDEDKNESKNSIKKVNAGTGSDINNAFSKTYKYNTNAPNTPDYYDKLMKYYIPSYTPPAGGLSPRVKAYNWYYILNDIFQAISTDSTGCTNVKPQGTNYYLTYYNVSKDDPNKRELQYCLLSEAALKNKDDKQMMDKSTKNGVVKGYDPNSSYNIVDDVLAVQALDYLNNFIQLESICSEDSNFPLCKATPIDCQKDPNRADCKDINGANATENEDDKQNSEQAVCMQNAGSLGWIVCPMIYGLRDAANGIFKNTVTPLLRVHDSIVEALAGNSESSTMYQAWSFFRNIGNILFVLAMLFVIFSQITGFGIDNYGIKKILPKLIVTAIIVNFSYIICGALVDLSNIAGDGIKNIFESVATNLNGNTTPSFADNVAGSVIDIVAAIGTGAAVAGSVATVVGAATSGSLLAIIVPVLAFVGSAVIAGLFAMLMLGLRQALIVIMIAISPVAFVLYAIPNTSGIFKKWLQLFKTLLTLYPVFCFMSGGGFLASNLIIKGSNEFYMKLIAGLISIAPFFMVPSMTKSAMKGFDGAVAGLSNLQSRVNRTGDTINRRVMNSDTMKSQAENAQLGKYRRLAERYKNTDTSKLGQWRKRQVIAAFNALTKSEHQDAVLDVAKSQYRFDTDPVNKENARVSAMREIDEKNKQQIMSGYADRNMSAGEALVQLDTAQRDYKYSDHSEQENHDHDVELAALQSHLLSTKDGQKMYNSYLSGKEIDTGVVDENDNKVTIKAGATSDRAKAVLARDYVNHHSDLKDKYQISFAQMRNIQGAGPVEKMKTEVSTANSLATNRQSGVNSFAESIDLKDIDKLGNKDAEELVQANLSGDSAQNTTAAVNAIVQQAESDPSKAGTYTPEIKRLIRRYSSNHTDLDNLGSRSFVVRDASGNVQQTIRLEQNNNNNNQSS